jgi:hypothetical protein
MVNLTCNECGKRFQRNGQGHRRQLKVFCCRRCRDRFHYQKGGKRRRKTFLDLTGNLYGKLKVIAFSGVNVRGDRLWRVHCLDCGKSKVMTAGVLRAGRCKTCGCARYRKQQARLLTLYFLEKELGPEAIAGFERLAQAKMDGDA